MRMSSFRFLQIQVPDCYYFHFPAAFCYYYYLWCDYSVDYARSAFHPSNLQLINYNLNIKVILKINTSSFVRVRVRMRLSASSSSGFWTGRNMYGGSERASPSLPYFNLILIFVFKLKEIKIPELVDWSSARAARRIS